MKKTERDIEDLCQLVQQGQGQQQGRVWVDPHSVDCIHAMNTEKPLCMLRLRPNYENHKAGPSWIYCVVGTPDAIRANLVAASKARKSKER